MATYEFTNGVTMQMLSLGSAQQYAFDNHCDIIRSW